MKKVNLRYGKVFLVFILIISMLTLAGCSSSGSSLKAKAEALRRSYNQPIAAGQFHTLILKEDGHVIARGSNTCNQCDVSDWSDIVQVAAGLDHSVGLKSDGTVVAVGNNNVGQCNVEGWKDIVQIHAADFFTFGVKSDGTVVTTDEFFQGLDTWTDIKQVNWGNFLIGIKNDGTVVMTSRVAIAPEIKAAVESWTDIVDVVSDRDYILGIKSDGSAVVVSEYKEAYEKTFNSWGSIASVELSRLGMMALLTDGNVEFYGQGGGRISPNNHNEDDWHDIVAIAKGHEHYIGLRSDGTLVAERSIRGWQIADYQDNGMAELDDIEGVRVPTK